MASRPRPTSARVLNLGIPAARRHAFDRITRILSSVEVDWMKWDFNADLGAGGWAPGLPELLTGQDPLVAHYEGLYRLQDAIRRWFPDLILEMCSSGGGRLDGEIMSHAHVNWISDQPGPVRKLAIHFGCQLAHPAVVCNDWLVEWPPGSIARQRGRRVRRRGCGRAWRPPVPSARRHARFSSASARAPTNGPPPISRSPRRMSRCTATSCVR